MSGLQENDREDARLWAGFRDSSPARQGQDPPLAGLIAPWLEGRCTPEECAMVEEALSGDPALLDSVAATHDALKSPEEDVPAHLAARISASLHVANPVAPRSAATGGFIGKWWKVAAAVLLITVASVSGFAAGRMRAPAQAASADAVDLADVIVEDWGWHGNGLDALVEVVEE